MLNRRNITEKTGAVCAYADFNNDRYTDVVHYHGGKLVVLFQVMVIIIRYVEMK